MVTPADGPGVPVRCSRCGAVETHGVHPSHFSEPLNQHDGCGGTWREARPTCGALLARMRRDIIAARRSVVKAWRALGLAAVACRRGDE
jgi:hypothetical protein